MCVTVNSTNINNMNNDGARCDESGTGGGRVTDLRMGMIKLNGLLETVSDLRPFQNKTVPYRKVFHLGSFFVAKNTQHQNETICGD